MKILTSILLLILFSAFVHAENMNFPEIGLSFALPEEETWTGNDKINIEDGSAILAFSSNAGHRVQVEYSSKSESLEVKAEEYFERVRNSSNATVNSEAPFSIDGIPAKKARIAISASDEIRKVLTIVTVIDGRSYTFLFHPIDRKSLEEEDVFRSIIESIKIHHQDKASNKPEAGNGVEASGQNDHP